MFLIQLHSAISRTFGTVYDSSKTLLGWGGGAVSCNLSRINSLETSDQDLSSRASKYLALETKQLRCKNVKNIQFCIRK
jgi:hypothetical protein